MAKRSGVRVSLIRDESCDHCNERTAEVIYCFKVRMPTGDVTQLWLHKGCLADLTEKLWMMDVRKKWPDQQIEEKTN